MLNLIVNADDFGYSRPTNDGIVRCFRSGIITSTSLLINGDEVEHAVDLINKYQIPTGLHLNLSEGLPLTKMSSLVDNNGYMLGKYGIREIQKTGKINLEQVELEMQAQLDKFEKIVHMKPTHVDGHQHIHVLPGICETFCNVLNRNDINVSRLSIEDIKDGHTPHDDFLQSVIEDSKRAKSTFEKCNIRYSDQFIGLYSSDLTYLNTRNILLGMLKGCCHGSISCELMVHPGYRTRELGGCGSGPDIFSQSCLREKEMEFLCDRKLKHFIQQSKINLSDFTYFRQKEQ